MSSKQRITTHLSLKYDAQVGVTGWDELGRVILLKSSAYEG
jgi:hypothetical protein